MEMDFFDIMEEPVYFGSESKKELVSFEFELKELALKARLDMEFYRLIVYSPSIYDTMINLFPRELIGIADDFACFLEKLLGTWDASLEISIDCAISVILDSIESNTFWWLADENNCRDPYKVTIALFESINYSCWHDHYGISIIYESTLQSILKYPIAIDWSKYIGVNITDAFDELDEILS